MIRSWEQNAVKIAISFFPDSLPERTQIPKFSFLGRRQAGKAQDFGSCIRRFESSRPSSNFQRRILPARAGQGVRVNHGFQKGS